jgi:hypothetical protein
MTRFARERSSATQADAEYRNGENPVPPARAIAAPLKRFRSATMCHTRDMSGPHAPADGRGSAPRRSPPGANCPLDPLSPRHSRDVSRSARGVATQGRRRTRLSRSGRSLRSLPFAPLRARTSFVPTGEHSSPLGQVRFGPPGCPPCRFAPRRLTGCCPRAAPAGGRRRRPKTRRNSRCSCWMHAAPLRAFNRHAGLPLSTAGLESRSTAMLSNPGAIPPGGPSVGAGLGRQKLSRKSASFTPSHRLPFGTRRNEPCRGRFSRKRMSLKLHSGKPFVTAELRPQESLLPRGDGAEMQRPKGRICGTACPVWSARSGFPSGRAAGREQCLLRGTRCAAGG